MLPAGSRYVQLTLNGLTSTGTGSFIPLFDAGWDSTPNVDAFKVIADLRGSAKLRDTWENGKGSMMTLDSAYSTLQVSKEFDESTLLAVYTMRVRLVP